ncbi:MAG: CPBP family intramembrane metalloprotease [Treponema sp.]|nr:CPBP family intramembrane metalloprotease [Treponema sp.]
MRKKIILSVFLYSLALIDSFILNHRIQNSSLSYVTALLYYLIVVGLLEYYLRPFHENLISLKSLKYGKYFKIKKIVVYTVITVTLIIKAIIYFQIEKSAHSPSWKMLLVYGSYAIGSVAEELLFRYTIYEKILKEKFPAIVSVVIAAFLFAVFHGSLNMDFFAYFVIGLIWTYLFDLYPCLPLFVTYHFIWNMLNP